MVNRPWLNKIHPFGCISCHLSGDASYHPWNRKNKLQSSFLFVDQSNHLLIWMRGHCGLITLIIHEKSNEHIQKLARHPASRHWALIKVCLVGIWIMNKHCRETATINLSSSPPCSKPLCIGMYQFLIHIFHYITLQEKSPTASLSTDRCITGFSVT